MMSCNHDTCDPKKRTGTVEKQQYEAQKSTVDPDQARTGDFGVTR